MHLRLLIILSLLGLATAAGAVGVGDRVDNFRLLDHEGRSHEFYYLSDMKAIVLMTHQVGCSAAEPAIASLNSVRARYGSKGVAVFMLNSSAGEARDPVRQESARIANSVPILLDPTQLIGESLTARTAGEVLVIDPVSWRVTYRGAVDGVGSTMEDLTNGVRAASRTKVSRVESNRLRGCKVVLPEAKRRRAHGRISYAEQIAPILKDNCLTCHREGGIGPWQMSSYEIVRGFAPMIREVVRTQRMPPWHADPHHGVFSNDRSLTAQEATQLVHWIEAGAPRGSGADPLLQQPRLASTWQLGEPDYIVEIPAFDVPATGAIPYQRPVVKNTLGRDVWLRAVEFAPKHRTVVHHILAGMTGPSTDGRGNLELLSAMGTFVPGDVPHLLPDDTAVLIPKDADFLFQMHYTANGKAVQEVTRIGLYFAKVPPKYPLRNTVLADPRLKIPPHTKAHTAWTSRKFDRDVLIYSLMPHSHVRGNGAEYVAEYPDGVREVLLSVPKYDFNWQTTYELAKPKLLPKGSSLFYSTTYDNSAQNKANPDPSIEVRWGSQTWEEMLYGDVRFRYPDEAVVIADGAANVAPRGGD